VTVLFEIPQLPWLVTALLFAVVVSSPKMTGFHVPARLSKLRARTDHSSSRPEPI
jgi:hypothetical protein